MSDLGFWDTLALVVIAWFLWALLLGMVRSLGKAWRNER